MPGSRVNPLADPQHTVHSALLRSRSDDDAAGDAEDAFTLARNVGVLSPEWVQTGCLYAPQRGAALSLLVLPVPPTPTKRHNVFHATCSAVAPSIALYRAYRFGALTWYDFALRYLAELDAKRDSALAQFVEQLCAVPARYGGVLLLGFRQAPGGNEALVRCPRRLLRAWLLDQVVTLPEVQRQLTQVGVC
jgi:uncharacterized protein YeaO (DUF488 family)